MILRPTAKLAKKLKTELLQNIDGKVTPFEEWYGHLFAANRHQLILFTHSYSLYSVLFPAKGINNLDLFAHSSAEFLREVMQLQGISYLCDRFIDKDFYRIKAYKTSNRGIIGSMNDMINQVKYLSDDPDLSLAEMSIRINKTPYSLIKYNYPLEIIKSMPLS